MKKPPTVHDVARLAGVSTATVSRYFNGKSAQLLPKTSQRVQEAVRHLGYTPSEVGRALRLSRSRVVVMVVPDVRNFFTADVALSVEKALQKGGRTLVLANAEEDAHKQDCLLRDAVGMRAEAIVLQGGIDTPLLREVSAQQGNCIFVNRRPPREITAPYVGLDNFAAAQMVGAHFLKRGYDNVVAMHGPRQYPGSTSRLEGFLAGFGDASAVTICEGDYSMEAGYQNACALLDKREPRMAFFCANDMMAYGVHRAAIERGLSIPADVKIFGFDGNRINDWLAPWLSTVRVPAELFGPAIAEIILDATGTRLEPRDILLPFDFHVSASA